ncbi:Plasma kallikrein [Exaiptasia diaphana]|nr:Plasma kallikrein [Exaiptasia diaphana]
MKAELKCGTKGKGNTRIVGGKKARKGAWPWQITMKYKNKSDLNYCGGSIIARDWIVTAAHCFSKSRNPRDYTVTIGEHNLKDTDGDEQKIAIKKIICHPRYNEYKHHKFDYDVALLKLKTNITYTDMVRPICLPTKRFSPGTNCYVTGWGYLFETEPGPSVLRQAIVPLISQKDCEKNFKDQDHPISSRMLCAGKAKGGANDACEGDSGGPLSCMASSGAWELAGVVSWGVGCASKDRYGVYANMENLKGWIKRVVHS